ncbi:P-loop containing nucleoside triphosphate hydrolase protein [Cladochytrium replicatum]|nr:P-loop containing nucleoside triphosphate hydrolase protein [Cladochytrium replicatum]
MGSPTQTSNTLLSSHAGAHKLPPESDDGPIEYKLKLIDPPPERLQHLVTQMKYRLSEGDGEAYYEIGVADNGTLVGLSDKDMEATLNSLRKMTSALHAEMSVVLERVIPAKSGSPRRVAEILIRRGASWSHDFMDVRVAMLGSHDAGKSSLLGILTHGELDNGRGKSRLNLLRHLHEIQSGRTSSISQQVIGFAEDGEIINYGSTNISSLEEICEVASKIVTFLDTCGHPKYQHTTIGGLTGQHPDYACLMVAANSGGISEITKEHLGIAVVLKLPVFVVMSKIDLATPEQLTSTIASLLSLLKSPAILRTPLIIQGESDVIESNIGFVSSRVVPIFLVSNVTGENLDLLTKFASQLPKPDAGSDQSKDEEVEFQVDETYSVPDVGCVVGGTLLSGLIDLSTLERYKYFLGPDRGHFIPVQITSVHRQRIPVQTLRPGQAASLALAFPATWSASESPLDASLTKGGFRTTEPPRNFKLRRGQVIIGPFVIASDNGPSGFAFSMDSPPLPATHAGLLLHVDDGMSLPLLSSSPATPDNFYRSGPNRRSYTPVLGNPGPLLFVGGTSPGGSAGASSASSDDDSEYPHHFGGEEWSRRSRGRKASTISWGVVDSVGICVVCCIVDCYCA